MSQQAQILVSVNKALARKLRKEASASLKATSKAISKSKTLDSEGVRRRRHIENTIIAKELGLTMEELIL